MAEYATRQTTSATAYPIVRLDLNQAHSPDRLWTVLHKDWVHGIRNGMEVIARDHEDSEPYRALCQIVEHSLAPYGDGVHDTYVELLITREWTEEATDAG